MPHTAAKKGPTPRRDLVHGMGRPPYAGGLSFPSPTAGHVATVLFYHKSGATASWRMASLLKVA
jgi:hypothetical protein